MSEQKKDLVTSFNKENPKTKYILISVAAFLISSFLPWITTVFGVAMGGWNGLNSLGNLAAIATIAFWILPKFNIDLGDLSKKTDQIYKLLSAIMAVSVVVFMLQFKFDFSIFGIGAYVGMISAGAYIYFTFLMPNPKKVNTIDKPEKNNNKNK